MPSRLDVVVKGAHSAGLGVWLTWINAPLWLQGEDGRYRPMTFRVDTGAMLTGIPEAVAVLHRLPVDAADAAVEVNEVTAGGTRRVQVRRGRVRVRLTPDAPTDPFYIPIQFLLGLPPSSTPPLLGLAGVIDQMTWEVDGRPSPSSLHGVCRLTDTR